MAAYLCQPCVSFSYLGIKLIIVVVIVVIVGHTFILQKHFLLFKIIYREVWPDDVFGKSGMSVEEEMEAVRSLFVHPLSGKHGEEGGVSLDSFYDHFSCKGPLRIYSI